MAFFLAVLVVMLSASGAIAQVDTDNDGLADGDEQSIYGTDPTVGDTDLDGLPDGVEVALGTSPLAADSDGDGATDAEEYLAGEDPLVASSSPAAVAVTQVPTTVASGSSSDVNVVGADFATVTVSPVASDLDVVPESLAFDDATSGGRSPLLPLYLLVAAVIAGIMVKWVIQMPSAHSERSY